MPLHSHGPCACEQVGHAIVATRREWRLSFNLGKVSWQRQGEAGGQWQVSGEAAASRSEQGVVRRERLHVGRPARRGGLPLIKRARQRAERPLLFGEAFDEQRRQGGRIAALVACDEGVDARGDILVVAHVDGDRLQLGVGVMQVGREEELRTGR